jgi:hypothetical protein
MNQAGRIALVGVLALAGVAASNPRSDPISIYAVIDRVVMTPDTNKPTAIQVWGAFSVSANRVGDNYSPAARGYLLLRMDPSKERQTLAEWNDLRRVAGTREIVGFGAKYAQTGAARVRCATEPPFKPDLYTINIGLVRDIGRYNTVADDIRKGLLAEKVPAAICTYGK